jgi:hypothetical protein
MRAGMNFCVIADARRQDLIEAWYRIIRSIRNAELRTRCKVLTWQELGSSLPGKLRGFWRRNREWHRFDTTSRSN